MWADSDAPTLAAVLHREGFPVGACELLSVRNAVAFLDAHRHVFGRDVVARLPARTAGRFARFGRELRDVDGHWTRIERASTQVCGATAAVALGVLAWVKAQLPLVRGVRIPYSLADHLPRHYVRMSRATAAIR